MSSHFERLYKQNMLPGAEFLSIHRKLSQYQTRMGAIIAIQLQSSIRKILDTHT